ncbi:thioredoxin [Prolixibacteraceae bacterium JC049]|nr:thioredoxin [Prolixibacteraceae bacterium JC049]
MQPFFIPITMQIELLYFSTPKCSVCHVLYPQLEQLISTNYSQFKLKHIDATQQPQLAAQNQVFTAPVLIIFIDNKEQQRFARHFSIQQVDAYLHRLSSFL